MFKNVTIIQQKIIWKQKICFSIVSVFVRVLTCLHLESWEIFLFRNILTQISSYFKYIDGAVIIFLYDTGLIDVVNRVNDIKPTIWIYS